MCFKLHENKILKNVIYINLDPYNYIQTRILSNGDVSFFVLIVYSYLRRLCVHKACTLDKKKKIGILCNFFQPISKTTKKTI